MKLNIYQKISPLKQAFKISRGAKTEAITVICELTKAGCIGRGECVPYARYGETPASVMAEIEKVRTQIEAGLTPGSLQTLLPAGAARCAVDTALWDLSAKLEETPVWQLAGLPTPAPAETAVTVSLDTPDAMGRAAARIDGGLLKLKLGGENDLDRVKAVHTARPDAKLILDGNEACTPSQFGPFCAMAAQYGAVLIEQPFPADADTQLAEFESPIPICADESVHTSKDIPHLQGLYGAVNVKLDKTGGLTEAITLIKAARAVNMEIMIGCMVAGSLSMAPAILLAGFATYTDLDGPLWLAEDIPNGLLYDKGYVHPPLSALWG